MKMNKDPFNLSTREQIIEILGIITIAIVMIGSFLKVLFL